MNSEGTVDSRGRLWLRCPLCEEPNYHEIKKKVHAFFSLRELSGYCYRCGSVLEPHHIPQERLTELFSTQKSTVFELESYTPEGLARFWSSLPLRPAVLGRKTSLEVRSYLSGTWDVFAQYQLRKSGIKLVGLHFRFLKAKRMVSLGERGLGFPNALPLHKWRIVEGPYDCTEEVDLCVFGMPATTLFSFLPKTVLLCPDGDVWTDASLFRPWFKLAEFSRRKGSSTFFEVLPDGKDPDEILSEERTMIPWNSKTFALPILKDPLAQEKPT